MHIIMDWFDCKLCPWFTNMQAQVKHLYCGGDPAQYDDYLIQPADQINRQLIEDEWPNIKPIISALGLKEITQSILINIDTQGPPLIFLKLELCDTNWIVHLKQGDNLFIHKVGDIEVQSLQHLKTGDRVQWTQSGTIKRYTRAIK